MNEIVTAVGGARPNGFLRKRLLAVLAQLRFGRLILEEDGEQLAFGTQDTQALDAVCIRVLHPDFYRAITLRGSVGAAEAYMEGHWSCSDLVGLVRLLVRNRDLLDGLETGPARIAAQLLRAWHALRRNTRAGSRRNIHAHYDLGNDFFGLFLSPDLMYSAAVWTEDPQDTLSAASERKLRLIGEKLELREQDRVIEIGSGWGGFACFAARHYGCHVTTITISREQFDYVKRRSTAEGLTDRINVLLRDYREVEGQYDKLVSIEMIEAVGAQYLDTYFGTLGRLLKPGGRALLQAITIEDHRYEQALRSVDFIKRYIFPGSFIPSIQALLAAKSRATDLTLMHLEDFGSSYARTLRAWRQRFLLQMPQIRALGFDEQFARMWEFYFAYCEGGFLEASIGVAQLLFVKPRSHNTEPAARGLLGMAERGWIPDTLLRAGIRSQCADRLRSEREGGPAGRARRYAEVLQLLQHSPIAVHTDAANSQHYEVPPEFFTRCLGPRLKYSCAYYPHGRESLAEAEELMLQLYAERADLADGQTVLELGCGWGSLTLWMAERYPNSNITAVSNSSSQRQYIVSQCESRGLRNVQVITQDVNTLDLPSGQFDRCLSIEMFEHLRNYGQLLERIARWLTPRGKLFVHIFAHAELMYPFETQGPGNWLGRHFFTGGLMPAADTLLQFQQHLNVEQRWLVSGEHYARTANDWLKNQDAQRHEILELFAKTYGPGQAHLWLQRWRMFWMACAELFGYAGGREWLVAHYLFARHPS